MAKGCEEVPVNTMGTVYRMGPVFYASLPCGPCDIEPRRRLVSTLLDHLAAMGSPVWERCPSFNRASLPIQVIRGLLGKPYLMLGEYRGPAVSFSESGGKVWAALCGDESDVGIDAAGTAEFQRGYPFHRVFHPGELQHALKFTGGDLETAAALLWSVKEAVVKALGSAFHLIAPREITVYPSDEGEIGRNRGHTFPVGLSDKALARFPIAAGRSLWAHALPHPKMWLSIAVLNRILTGNE